MKKYLVIGLGNFGSTLAKTLTASGNEVVAVDIDMQKVEAVKNEVSLSVALDTRELHSINSLPIEECDAVIVAIGEDFAASIMTVAQLKQLKAKRIICRTFSPLHTTVLESLKVDEILLPEQDAAYKLAKRINMQNVINALELNSAYSIVEIKAPSRYIGKQIAEIDFKGRYQLDVITVKVFKEVNNIFGVRTKDYEIPTEYLKTVLNKNDVLVIYGKNADIAKMTSEA